MISFSAGTSCPLWDTRHAYGNAFLRSFGAGNADKAEHNVVAGVGRVREECQLLARRIREDGFEDEAFTLSDEFVSKSIGNLRPRRADMLSSRAM